MKESYNAVELQLTLRDLWIDHIFWVSLVVFATKFGDTEAAKDCRQCLLPTHKLTWDITSLKLTQSCNCQEILLEFSSIKYYYRRLQ